MHHATLVMPVSDMPLGWTTRVLHLKKRDGSVEVFMPLVDYTKAHPTRSKAWQDTIARALGLLWDFCQVSERLGDSLSGTEMGQFRRSLLRSFALALITGTVDPRTKEDLRGLYWPKTPRSRAVDLVRSIESFAQWSADEDRNSDLLPAAKGAPNDGLTMTELLVWSRLRNLSMLSHLSTPEAKKTASVVDFGQNPRGPGTEEVKFFPPAYAERLLWEGHVRPGPAKGNPFLDYNVRDQMIALLDGWGGLRESEAFHLWVQDVVEDPEASGHAFVVLNHPAESLVQFMDLAGQPMSATREEALGRLYSLRPRNKVTRGRYHAGWKGMDLDRSYQAVIHWLDPKAGALFWVLYHGYLRYVRGPVMARRRALGLPDHPFLFVSEGVSNRSDAGAIGDPYSIRAYEQHHEAAVGRLQLPYGKEHGTTTHGLRHLYGQSLARLNVPPQIIKKGMHHRQYLSQVVYTVPPKKVVNEELNAAWARLESGDARPIAPLGNDASDALVRLKDFITSGRPR